MTTPKRSANPGFKQWLSYLALRALLPLIAWLPLGMSRKLGAALGYAYYRLFKKRVNYARVNMRLCFPELDEEAREERVKQSLMHTGMWFFETAAIWFGPTEKILQRVHVANPELLEDALQQQRGIILAIPHMGNWEILGPLLSRRRDFACFYQHDDKRPLISDYIYRSRSRLGTTMAPADASGVRILYRHLKAGKIAGLLPDHIPSENMGVFAPFFGRQALTGTLISSLAHKNDAIVLTAAVVRTDNGFVLHYGEVAEQHCGDAATAATALNRALEQAIGQAPAQFQWVYPRFRKQQPGNWTPSPYRQSLTAAD